MDLPNLLLLHWQLLLFILLCVAAFIQLFYFLFFFSRLAFYSVKPKTILQTHAVSVIVCARDEAANLANNLPGVLIQDYKTTHEVIVVNDNSFDESKYILEQLKREYKQMQVVELTQEAKLIPGKKFPLSIGIKTAKHEILLLTDADCVQKILCGERTQLFCKKDFGPHPCMECQPVHSSGIAVQCEMFPT